MNFVKGKQIGIQKCRLQLLFNHLNNNVGEQSNFCFSINQGTLFINKQIKIPYLVEYSSLIMISLNQNMRLQSKTILLKNGEIFQFKNFIRGRQVIEFANLLSYEIRGGSMDIHPQRLSFEINKSQSLHNQMDLNKIMNILTDTITFQRETTIFNVYTALRLGGEIDSQIENIVSKKGIRIKNFSKNNEKDITQMIENLLLKQRDNKPLLENQIIQQFRQSSNLPKQTNQNGRIVSLPKVLKVQSHIDDSKIHKYSEYLNQQPGGKKNQYDKIRVVENINLVDHQNFKSIYSQKSSEISAATNNFRYIEQQPIIKRVIVKKQYLAKQDKINFQKQKKVINYMKDKSSCYIAKYYDINKDVSNKFFQNSIIMDYYDSGCSNNLLQDTKNVISNKTKLEVMYKISQGLRFLRDCNIIHRDLKFENVLIARDLGIKISDFGESYIKGSNMQLTTRRTLPYAPPEFYQSNPQTITSSYDTYAFGIMLNKILTQRFILPFRTGTSCKLLSQIISEQKYPNYLFLNIQKYQSMYSPQISKLFLLIITLCLHPNPLKRPNQDIISIILLIINRNLISSLLFNPEKQQISVY